MTIRQWHLTGGRHSGSGAAPAGARGGRRWV